MRSCKGRNTWKTWREREGRDDKERETIKRENVTLFLIQSCFKFKLNS
jgi:hypothetical protein